MINPLHKCSTPGSAIIKVSIKVCCDSDMRFYGCKLHQITIYVSFQYNNPLSNAM